MKYILLLLLTFLVDSTMRSEGIRFPEPVNCYPLNDGRICDVLHDMPNSANPVTPAQDRFGDMKGASSPCKSERVLLDRPVSEKGLTVTFWYYNDNCHNSTIFSGRDEVNRTIFSFSKKNGFPCLGMYHKIAAHELSLDTQRLWDNCIMDKEGWYYITLALSPNGTTIYMFNPDDQLNTCFSSFVMEPERLASIEFGALASDKEAVDDFKMYNDALSSDQVIGMYRVERAFPLGENTISNFDTGVGLLGSGWYFYCVEVDGDDTYFILRNGDNVLATDGKSVYKGAKTNESEEWIVKYQNSNAFFTIESESQSKFIGVDDVLCPLGDKASETLWSFHSPMGSVWLEKGGTSVYDDSVEWNRIDKCIEVLIHNPQQDSLDILVTSIGGDNVFKKTLFNLVETQKIQIDIPGVYLVTVTGSLNKRCYKIFANF